MARRVGRADDATMHSYVTEPPTLGLAGRSRPQWAAAWATRLGLDTAYLLLGLPAGVIAFSVVISGWATALGLAITLIGLPIAMATIIVSRGMANVERWRAALVLGGPVRARYRPITTGRILERLKALFADTQTWKDLGWHLLLLPVGIVGFTVAICCWAWTVACLTVPLWFSLPADPVQIAGIDVDTWWWALLFFAAGVVTLPISVCLLRGTAAGTGSLARLLLGADTEELSERVEVLTETRAGAVDAAGGRARAHRARPARRRAGASRRARAWTSGWPRSASSATPTARASSSSKRATRRSSRSPSCATSPAASARPCSPSAASAAALRALASRTQLPTAVSVEPGGRVARAGRVGRVLRRRRGAHQRRQAQPRGAPAVDVSARRRRPGRPGRRRRRGRRRPGGQRPDRPAQAHRGARRRAAHREPARRPDRSCARSSRARRDRRGPRAPARRAHAPARRHGFEVVAAVDDGDAAGRRRRRATSRTSASSTSACRRRSPTRASARRSRRAARSPGCRCSCSRSTSSGRSRPSCSPTAAAASATCSRTASPTSREFVDAVRRVADGGTALDPEAVAQLLGGRRATARSTSSPRASARSSALMAEGRSNAAIAERLVVTEGAVEKHSVEHLRQARPAALRHRPPPGPGRARVAARLTRGLRRRSGAERVGRRLGWRAWSAARRSSPRSAPPRATPRSSCGWSRPGMDVARLNFSHGTAEQHAETAAARPRRGRPRRAPGRDHAGPPGPEAAHRRAARRTPPSSSPATRVTFVCGRRQRRARRRARG